ncbi:serine threonine protein kinase : Serine/threonine protein kinase-related protein OS=Planctomyces limnophilus (strain ATCC 43296 / DSM 3776 / IFAM 1008 / 290) GN=Plim_2182 PE=4 SV=1: Pkinase [Gemmataceae bacterium]|nr:serine threonine protein kinase : Serine/threonine protein kinase-related protein OS=Planctomyces limnophilus (strain ATCC 43296 / DSM 3776 / IFAM 1008 / 290) GN=Plim_2182 PE=4 SV=1: Pkinase [Gemmataceae bacterium]VTT98169.1 serine threonine protein kinase : Serine/threonine protein kinase-related protein OS=Planctomyces limnophilus (strain ATCC 43296 / DSM 3776 / IFAM 1008 / 290) GN=Plim_2182 PE=4 SV=1: Pkinase [Gemmataceae bacterium]
MPLATLDEFVAALHHLPVLPPDWKARLPALRDQFPDVRALGEELIRLGALTPFQADRVARGRAGELVLGGYAVIERLGEGGAGQVYKAWDAEHSRFAALKVLRAELVADPETVGRFHREICVSRGLPPHPNLIATLDAGRVGEAHFLAMEYAEGTDLERLVKQSGPLPVERACEYARQAALGLQHAHEHGLVHRDVKPSNFLVTGPDAGTVKLLDLGLARLHAAAGEQRDTFMTSDGSATLGTVDYQAPEQALDFHAADTRADVYSLGCTLFYLLTGEPPFGTGPLATKLMKHQQAEPPDLAAVRPDAPPALAALVRRMLAKAPADRFATPGEVAAALDAVLRPPPARNPDPKRSRLPVAVAAVVAGAALAVGLVYAALPASPARSVEEPEPPAAPPKAKPKPPPQSDGIEAMVPEAAEYQLVYDLNLARLGRDVAYDADRRSRVARPFDRVAYFLELRKADGEAQYLYVSMAAFTTDAGQVGVPTAGGAVFQTRVASMNVYSNVPGVVTGTGIATGNIEFWSSNYGPGNGAKVPNADSGKYDFGDQPSGPHDGHGSMQVHNYGAKQTLFAVNKWRAGPDRAEIGIGNNPKGNPDWTFTESGGSYRTKRLRVLVRCP